MDLAYKSLTSPESYDLFKQLTSGCNLSKKKVAEMLKISQKTVRRAVQSTNLIGPKKKRGRPTVLTPQIILHIESNTLSDRRKSSNDIAADILNLFNVRVSEKTVERARKDMGFKFRPPINSVLMSPTAKATRVSWARSHKTINWEKIVFTDESYFQLTSDRSWLRRRAGEEGEEVRFHAQLHPEKILVWGGIGKDYKTDLIILEGKTVDQTAYILDIIKPSGLLETAPSHFNNDWLLQQDNARPYVSKFSTEQLQQMGIKTLERWPPYSPDLNVIEVIWAIIKHRVKRRNPKTTSELKILVRTVWYEISFETINGLIRSMPSRCQKVVDSCGRTIS